MKLKVGDRVRLKSVPHGLNGATGTIVYRDEIWDAMPFLVQLDEPHWAAHQGGCGKLPTPHTGWYVGEDTAEVIEAAEPQEGEEVEDGTIPEEGYTGTDCLVCPWCGMAQEYHEPEDFSAERLTTICENCEKEIWYGVEVERRYYATKPPSATE